MAFVMVILVFFTFVEPPMFIPMTWDPLACALVATSNMPTIGTPFLFATSSASP